MIIKQISTFMENTSGRLADITALLAKAGINLRAISIADTTDFGILRMVADQPDAAVRLLKDAGFTARETDVIGVEVPDHPGELARIGLEPGAALAIETRRGKITLTARTDPLMPEGMVFVPFCYVEAAANMLTNPALDPYGKIPEFKYAACKLGAGDGAGQPA